MTDPQRALHILADSLARDVILLTDEEVVEEVRQDPLSPSPERVRTILLGAIAEYRRRSLDVAREQRKQKLGVMNALKIRVPSDAGARRTILQTVFALDNEDANQLLTAYGRELDEIPDEETAELIKQLVVLGVIKAPDE